MERCMNNLKRKVGWRSNLISVVLLCLVGGGVFANDSSHVDDDLRAQIEALQHDVAHSATSIENIDERLDVFWHWANAYALSGLPIDPDIPATVARIRDPGPKENVSPLDLADVDRWIKEFTYREANPKAVGSISSPRLKGFEVDQFHTLEVTYTVGERALGPGDGFVLGELTYGKGALLQGRDPLADDFVSIHSDQSDVTFDLDSYPIRGMFSGTMKRSVVMTGPASKVYFRIKSGMLPAGSVVTVVLGDKSKGSRGLGLIAPSVDALRFRVWLSLDKEALLMALPELEFSSVGGPVAAVRGFGPSIVAPGEEFEITVRYEDQFRNRATGTVPKAKVLLGKKVIARLPSGSEALQKIAGISIAEPGVHRLTVVAGDGVASGTFNPIVVKENPDNRLYWGETHGHSGFSEGMGSVDGVYQFARDDARLDFMALTEHDYWMDDAEWEVLRAAAQKYDDPGKFLTYLSYEWTVHAINGGHHNILFRTPDDRSRVSRQDVQTLPGLYKRLSAENDEQDLLIIPHAHNPGDWTLTDASTERFVEVVSLHGTFEWFGRNYLDSGHNVGFLGGSDDHMGHPGLRPLRRNPTSDNFGGLLGLYAKDKSSDEIFDAMRKVQGYATNGARIVLDAKMNGSRTGERGKAADTASFSGYVYGTAPIEEIVYIKNGQAVHKIDYADSTGSDSEFLELRLWSDSEPSAKGALARQWRRWRGTIEVVGAELKDFSSPQNDNPFTEFVRRRDEEPNKIDFFLKTRGSFKGVILELAKQKPGAVLKFSGVKESPLSNETFSTFDFSVAVDDLNSGPARFDVETDGYDDHAVLRIVRRPAELDREINYTHDVPAKPGDYYYLRILQTDGGIAWSSPIRITP
jgi:hypothetical protein